MSGIETLIRLQKWKVDEQRRALGTLEAERARFIKQGEDLEKQVIQEQSIALTEDLTQHYGPFAAGVIERRAILENEIKQVDEKIAVLHEELSELFQELKRYEIARDRREADAALEENRAEHHELDEIGMKMFQRNQN